MQAVYGWSICWQGAVLNTGYTVHVGTGLQYLALYRPVDLQKISSDPHGFLGGLNHIEVCVRDLEACEARVKKARFTPSEHAEYDEGHDFYGIAYKVASYSFE